MKKVLSVLICISIVFSAFVGCSKGASGSASDSRITIDSHYVGIEESAINAYKKLCKAVINGEKEVKFNTQLLDDVTLLFYTSFPLNALVRNIYVMTDKTGMEISYRNDVDTHKQLVSDFNEKVDEILDACEYKRVSNDKFIFNVYTYISSNFEIDNSVVTPYDTIMNGKGVAAAINSVFEYILLTAGCEASHIINKDGKGAIVSIVKFAFDYYYFDAGSEISDNSGKALRYFAMDYKRLSGYASGEFKYTNDDTAPKLTDDTYSALENSSSYTLTEEGISVECSDKSEPFIIKIV